MFDISFLEVTVICAITLIVVGPERLPGLVRDVGRIVRKLRRVVTQTRYELEREFSLEEERKRLSKDGDEFKDAIDELDDLMDIATDKDQVENKPDPEPQKQPSDK